MNIKFITSIFCVLIPLINAPFAHAANWTLQSSIAQAMSSSPELQRASAIIGERNAELQLSEMWPDPSIEFKIDNQVGLDTGSGDYNLSEITLSQDIPFSRIEHQSAVASAQLNAAVHAQGNAALILQNNVAKIFYKLQLVSATYTLAQQRVALADKLNASTNKNKRDPMVRYLTPLEKMRLNILREKAYQSEAAAEGKRRETLIEFFKLLSMNSNQQITVPALLPVKNRTTLYDLEKMQNTHPLISSQLQNLQAASNEIELARSSSMRDPSISINRLRENFSTGTESVYGIMLNLEIPIHDRKSTSVSKAKYNVSQQRIELARLKRNLQLNLSRSYTHLNHVIEQASKYKEKVLKPAEEILKLSEKGFMSGELNVLSLVDANNTYFDSNMQYIELVYQAWMEIAEINLNAGKLIIIPENEQQLSYNTAGVQ